jgi:hypothetical protein
MLKNFLNTLDLTFHHEAKKICIIVSSSVENVYKDLHFFLLVFLVNLQLL